MDLMDNIDNINVFTENNKVFSNSNIYPPQYIGPDANVSNSLISNGCRVYGSVRHSILGSGAVIAEGAVVEDSIVLPNAFVGRDCHITRAIVNEGSTVEDRNDVGSRDGEIEVFGDAKLSV